MAESLLVRQVPRQQPLAVARLDTALLRGRRGGVVFGRGPLADPRMAGQRRLEVLGRQLARGSVGGGQQGVRGAEGTAAPAPARPTPARTGSAGAGRGRRRPAGRRTSSAEPRDVTPRDGIVGSVVSRTVASIRPYGRSSAMNTSPGLSIPNGERSTRKWCLFGAENLISARLRLGLQDRGPHQLERLLERAAVRRRERLQQRRPHRGRRTRPSRRRVSVAAPPGRRARWPASGRRPPPAWCTRP